jgi:hypothetical protein
VIEVGVTVTLALADREAALLARAVAALEALVPAVDPEPPGLAPAGPLVLVPTGAKVDYSVSSIPLGKDGIQRLNAGDYDGPVDWVLTQGPAVVAPETPDGLAGRLVLDPGAAEGDVIAVEATADIRHGDGVVGSVAHFTYEVVAADAPPLTGAGFDVVDHAERPA